jgi:putative tricarboxylic transport membrane protein
MNIRADHAAGAFFVAFGLLIVFLSGDLPIGGLSMPGAGFMPLLVAALIIVFGASLFFRARESRPFSEITWDDGKHAASVLVITAAAVAFYVTLGFIITMILMMLALLVIIERRNALRAGLYSAAVVVVTYLVFVHMLQSPLPPGVLGYY